MYGYLGNLRTVGTVLEIAGGRPLSGFDIAQDVLIRLAGLDALGQVVADVTLGAVAMNVSPPHPC